ncbi:hypothetical protein ACFSUS_00240 [Spirosoma soli]|uniref:Uncharacterized protein n=1 Tax=Spirosoma soli TaxID=1770529 RepID=A0ABW5LW89_9BACT
MANYKSAVLLMMKAVLTGNRIYSGGKVIAEGVMTKAGVYRAGVVFVFYSLRGYAVTLRGLSRYESLTIDQLHQ